MAIVIDKDYSKRRCKDGIIAEYLRYCEGQESPIDFHIWTCIGTLALALGRNAWYNRGAWKVYPNLYIILVGESALVHKNTALNMGLNPLKTALPELEEIGQKITPEALIGMLSTLCKDANKRAEAYIHADELSVLLGKSQLDDSLIKLLTDLWDCKDTMTYQTRSRGKEFLRDVCINMLGGTTPDWLRNSVSQDSLEGGFFSRLILVQRPPTGEKNPFPEDSMNLKSRAAIENVMHDLQVINNSIHGAFEWDLEGKKAYANWYCNYNNPEEATSFMRGYYGRKGDFVLKLAMLSSVNFTNSKQITCDDVMFAVKLLNENEMYTKELVKFMGTTSSGRLYVSVLNKISRNIVEYRDGQGNVKQVCGIEHARLQRNIGHQMKTFELADIIQGLLDAQEIEIFYNGTMKIYRKLTRGKITEMVENDIKKAVANEE